MRLYEQMVAAALQLAISATFLWAAYTKLVSPSAFIETVHDYRLVPKSLVSVTGYLVISGEAITTIILLSGQLLIIGYSICIVLLMSFLTAITINLRRERRIACGCFGNRNDPISLRSVGRIAALLIVALIAAFESIRVQPWSALHAFNTTTELVTTAYVGASAAFTIAAIQWLLVADRLMPLWPRSSTMHLVVEDSG